MIEINQLGIKFIKKNIYWKNREIKKRNNRIKNLKRVES